MSPATALSEIEMELGETITTHQFIFGWPMGYLWFGMCTRVKMNLGNEWFQSPPDEFESTRHGIKYFLLFVRVDNFNFSQNRSGTK